jgi:hypothetical protein
MARIAPNRSLRTPVTFAMVELPFRRAASQANSDGGADARPWRIPRPA